MGEIADSMINGEFDYITGEYLGRPTGYPRTYSGIKRKRKTSHNPKRGVTIYLSRHGIDKTQHIDIIRKYVTESTALVIITNETKHFLCSMISKDFNSFRKWFSLNYIKK